MKNFNKELARFQQKRSLDSFIGRYRSPVYLSVITYGALYFGLVQTNYASLTSVGIVISTAIPGFTAAAIIALEVFLIISAVSIASRFLFGFYRNYRESLRKQYNKYFLGVGNGNYSEQEFIRCQLNKNLKPGGTVIPNLLTLGLSLSCFFIPVLYLEIPISLALGFPAAGLTFLLWICLDEIGIPFFSTYQVQQWSSSCLETFIKEIKNEINYAFRDFTHMLDAIVHNVQRDLYDTLTSAYQLNFFASLQSACNILVSITGLEYFRNIYSLPTRLCRSATNVQDSAIQAYKNTADALHCMGHSIGIN